MDGVDFVDDHALQILEIVARALPGAEQGQLFRRGQQNVRGGCPLTLAPGLSGVARARLHDDGEIHVPDRRQQVPFDIDRQGLEGGDVERVKDLAALARAAFGELQEAGQEAGEGLAAACRRHEQDVGAGFRLVDHVQLVGAQGPAAVHEPVAKRRWKLVRRIRCRGRDPMRLGHGLSNPPQERAFPEAEARAVRVGG
ncbi:hypothetical protein D3C85_1181940 [compost metagenome]